MAKTLKSAATNSVWGSLRTQGACPILASRISVILEVDCTQSSRAELCHSAKMPCALLGTTVQMIRHPSSKQ